MQIADVWSCGVMLFIMLAAAYPFGRPEDEQLKPSKKMHVMLQVRSFLSVPFEIIAWSRHQASKRSSYVITLRCD